MHQYHGLTLAHVLNVPADTRGPHEAAGLMMGPRGTFLFPPVQLISGLLMSGQLISLRRIAHAKTRGPVPERTP
jgi:hypothetical protein